MSEPNRGRRKWKGKREAQQATYANRRRIRGQRGKRLQRGEKLERTFAHLLTTGGLRRVQVRGQEEIRKRMLLHAAAFNLGLLMRQHFGVGTPRSLQGRTTLAGQVKALVCRFFRRIRLLRALAGPTTVLSRRTARFLRFSRPSVYLNRTATFGRRLPLSSTDC